MNFRFVGNFDVDKIKEKIIENGQDPWRENSVRQKIYDVHKDTQTIPLLWDLKSLQHNTIGEKTEYYDLYDVESYFYDIKKVLEQFYGEGRIVRIILTKLKKRKKIYPHTDDTISLSLCNRIHIPIITNENVVFLVGGESKVMLEGEMWEINNLKEHSVSNDGKSDRVHLIIDYYASKKFRD